MDSTPSLSEVVKQVMQQQQTQASEIQRNKTVLSQYQTELHELEMELKSVLLEAKEVDKKICQAEGAIENTTHQCEILENQNYSIHAENIRLKLDLETQKEDFESIVSRNNEYRKRIAENSNRFSVAENKLPFMIELIKKRDTIKLLKRQKEEMILDIHNPGSAAVMQVQVQKKRYEAILKRLHSQLNKTQLNRRQCQWNIEQMEKTASSLREGLGMMQ
ncbi:coiled-coil domain-containing protein 122 isoform X3 [Pseudophryne corroboree]|uniref:coiled-coil domain-containing protein 122 isoform X3 n=1 Tax=Pseudophryne corroboree TaxID=495146 RepID=UPI003081FF6A